MNVNGASQNRNSSLHNRPEQGLHSVHHKNQHFSFFFFWLPLLCFEDKFPSQSSKQQQAARGNCCGTELGTTAYQGGHNPYLSSSTMLQEQVSQTRARGPRHTPSTNTPKYR